LRQKWLFEDNRGPFEKMSNFKSSGTILSVVIFLTNEAGILRFPLGRFTSKLFGRTLFWGMGFTLAFFFLLTFGGFVYYSRFDSMDL